ncbi:Co2+/Mg2+ efflux protein ApaG [Alteromonas sp. ASW11-130]|uniref:Co2+/Mg2+ efflux protein ApaG n=1 Tax=Alteromonas sp. ASW11-130 TaxID=3015775 RepID=UPI002241CA21|nr:Co2+/Mg2+ efflux protein ApaG [Alteromonas sp. ASW11-130]MCW8090482.1 Co2+/Mg2+ efflux protein ApaG [Alteromonas sp. ASW11-130]
MDEISDPPVRVEVSARYLPDHPASTEQKYAFAYHVTITNLSNEIVKLINRYWLICDADGKSMEVEGAGVVGKQPTLKPKEQFEYTSGAIIDCPVGSMQGYYEMQREDESIFRVPIDVFSLAVPNIVN